MSIYELTAHLQLIEDLFVTNITCVHLHQHQRRKCDLGCVAEKESPEHHDAADGHQDDAHDGAQLQSHPRPRPTL